MHEGRGQDDEDGCVGGRPGKNAVFISPSSCMGAFIDEIQNLLIPVLFSFTFGNLIITGMKDQYVRCLSRGFTNCQ